MVGMRAGETTVRQLCAGLSRSLITPLLVTLSCSFARKKPFTRSAAVRCSGSLLAGLPVRRASTVVPKASQNQLDTEDVNKKLNEAVANTTTFLQVGFAPTNLNTPAVLILQLFCRCITAKTRTAVALRRGLRGCALISRPSSWSAAAL